MKLKRQAIVNTLSPIVEKSGYSYMIDEEGNTPVVFAKKCTEKLYFSLLIGGEVSNDGAFSIEISLSSSTNAGLKGRDIPSRSICRLGESFWTTEMLSDDSELIESITLAESHMLQDTTMIKELEQSKKLMLETQLEKWVISWYHEKEESKLPLLSFVRFTPKEPVDDIDLKWFVIAEIVLRVTWMQTDKRRVSSLGIQAFWKECLDA